MHGVSAFESFPSVVTGNKYNKYSRWVKNYLNMKCHELTILDNL